MSTGAEDRARPAPGGTWSWTRLTSFGVVGCAGFLVDAGVLHVSLAFGTGPYRGRLLSYLTAVTATWLLNRRYTFGRRTAGAGIPALGREWAKFVASQLAGALVNLLLYALLIRTSKLVASYPTIGVAVGSLCGLLANFWTARTYVFAD